MSDDLISAIVNFEKEKALNDVQARLEGEEDPLQIIDECRKGMEIVGEKYSKGEYYLSELVLSGQIFKAVFALVQPHLLDTDQEEKGAIVMATVQGDLHDIGKDIVANLFESRGFRVFNLGVDVLPDAIVQKIKEVKAGYVGLSCLLTTSIQSMKETIEAIEAAGLREGVIVLVGGGVTQPDTKDFVGADFQTRDAMAGIEYCLQVEMGKDLR
jgi:methylmalonyl-CoA mutase cobalamin-binding domain/chain